jgi:tRNA-Thr(GGU) m(6)t(6)A37 methyltransferase TsaA
MGKKSKEEDTFSMHPIGYVKSSENGFTLEILKPFRPALKQLDQFSHVIVFWWANQCDSEERRNIMQCEPPYAKGKLTGVFACRAEYRPNPIMITTCNILYIDEKNGVIQIPYIDAFDGTPIVDLKAFFPIERPKNVEVPEWVSDWPEWMEDAAEWMPEWAMEG